MITRGVATWNRLRRCFSPTEWFVRWLRLPRAESAAYDRGLVLIQIDGLSRVQLQHAIDAGRMPFLKSLVDREHYHVHDFYSGLPASTPSVQGELFYGERCAVPAFGFRDHRSGKVVRMFSREVASDVEERISRGTRGILRGGSAYCNIYDGGADEAHFCASSMGWSDLIQRVSFWKLIPLSLWHLWSAFRVGGLLAVELILACLSFVRGAITKQEYWQELLMIPARVVVVILMRELAIIGATIDVVRGVPIVQLNLLGYDEQAHRRGPESGFAHWTLKGIDRAMAGLWRAAHRSDCREYDVWIYSDHGQIRTTPYEYVAGEQIVDAVAAVVDNVCGPNEPASSHPSLGLYRPSQSESKESDGSRASWLSAGWLVGRLFGEGKQDLCDGANGVQVAALGPLGLIYTNRNVSRAQRLKIATQLVTERNVPLAFVAQGEKVIGINPRGHFDLATEPASVLGEDHPFLSETAVDMIRLCNHPDAGDVVVSGWVRGGDSLSFAIQSGAHAGPSPEETGAFLMAPSDVHLIDDKPYIRPNDLRLAVARFLHTKPPRFALDSWPSPRHSLRIMTYNVHGCVGMDGRLDPRRIARVIAQSQADIVALQELDVCRARSGYQDQAQEIARLLEMQCHFHPAWSMEEELYGDAILSRVPMRLVRKDSLPASNGRQEPRGAIWVEVEPVHGLKVQVINTHLSIYPRERNRQAETVAVNWVQPAKELGTTLACGDFNAQPNSRAYQHLSQIARDVQSYPSRGKPAPTFFSPRPLARIDHVFVSDDVEVMATRVLDSRLARVASDHLPLIADVAIPLANPRDVSVRVTDCKGEAKC